MRFGEDYRKGLSEKYAFLRKNTGMMNGPMVNDKNRPQGTDPM